jgi:hypothetical protein
MVATRPILVLRWSSSTSTGSNESFLFAMSPHSLEDLFIRLYGCEGFKMLCGYRNRRGQYLAIVRSNQEDYHPEPILDTNSPSHLLNANKWHVGHILVCCLTSRNRVWCHESYNDDLYSCLEIQDFHARLT